jgi:hypothetical protein
MFQKDFNNIVKMFKCNVKKSNRLSIKKLRLRNKCIAILCKNEKQHEKIETRIKDVVVIDLTCDDNDDDNGYNEDDECIDALSRNIFNYKVKNEQYNDIMNDDSLHSLKKSEYIDDMNNESVQSSANSEEKYMKNSTDSDYSYISDDDISEEVNSNNEDNLNIKLNVHNKYVTMSLTNIEIEITKYVAVLERYGIKSFFTSTIGGKISMKRINAISRRLCHCVYWTYNLCDPPVERLLDKYNEFNEQTFMRYVKCFITRDYVLLSSYGAYCEKYTGLKSSTTKGIITEIYAGIKWFVLFKNTSKFHVKPDRISGIEETVKGLRKCLSKDIKKNKPDATLSKVTYDLKLPEGSSSLEQLQVLQKHLKDQIPRVNHILFGFIKENILTRNDYNFFMRILYSSLYIFSPQGRIGGIESLLYKNGIQLLSDNYALTDKFKTQATFSKQPIILGETSKDLFSLYFNNLRPYVVSQNFIKDNHSDAPMWLTFEGKQQLNIGQQMTNYFIQALNLNITTNGLRSLVETLCDGLHRLKIYIIKVFFK